MIFTRTSSFSVVCVGIFDGPRFWKYNPYDFSRSSLEIVPILMPRRPISRLRNNAPGKENEFHRKIRAAGFTIHTSKRERGVA